MPARSILALAWLLAVAPAAAAERTASAAAFRNLGQVTLPVTIQLRGEPLSLAACRDRPLLGLDLYVAALYLPKEGAPAMGSPDHPKAIVATLFGASVLPLGLPRRYRAALTGLLPAAEIEAIDRRIAGLQRGDTVWLVYTPGEGTRVMVNGATVADAPGPEVAAALLKTWTGEKPLAGKLGELLGKYPC
jgi:hypothetical protein